MPSNHNSPAGNIPVKSEAARKRLRARTTVRRFGMESKQVKRVYRSR